MFYDPYKAIHAQIVMGQMTLEASAVIWMRMLGMGGMWSVPKSENNRMVQEKQKAFAEAGFQAMRAAWAGHGPQGMLDAAIKPINRTAKANRKRLSRRGIRVVKP